jgi:hypothetical protein
MGLYKHHLCRYIGILIVLLVLLEYKFHPYPADWLFSEFSRPLYLFIRIGISDYAPYFNYVRWIGIFVRFFPEIVYLWLIGMFCSPKFYDYCFE